MTDRPKRTEGGNGVGLALLTAVLAFVGGVGGSWVGSYLELGRWRFQTEHAARQELVRKRIDLTERTVRLTVQLGNAALMRAVAVHAVQEAVHLRNSGQPTVSTVDTAAAETLKLNELQAEVGTVLTLDALYFGPEAKAAVTRLDQALQASKPWWKVDPKLFRALLDAMERDLMRDLEPTGGPKGAG